MANFSVGSSVKGVSAYINRLTKIEGVVENVIPKSFNKIATRYTNIAKKNLMATTHSQKYGDELASEIYYTIDDKGINIIAGMSQDYIKQLYYAEFGAGMVGRKHPLANAYGWQYDLNKHGKKGWRYKTTQADKTKTIDMETHPESAQVHYDSGIPFKYQRKDGSWIAWTNYSKPALFMYKTHKAIQQDGYLENLILEDLKNLKYGGK